MITTDPVADRVTPARLEKWRGAVSEAVTMIGQVRLDLAAGEHARTGAKGAAAMNTPEDTALLDTQEALRHVWGDLNRALPPATATLHSRTGETVVTATQGASATCSRLTLRTPANF